MSRSAAYIYADWGIRCNTIQPGFIETNMTKAILDNPIAKKSLEETMHNTILLRRAGKPEEIGYTAFVPGQRRLRVHHQERHPRRRRLVQRRPYLGNERSQHTLDMIKKKAEQDQELGKNLDP